MLWAVQDTGAQCKRERGVPAVSCMGKGVPCAAALRLGGLAQSRQADVVRLGIQHMKLQGEESAAPVVCMPVMQLATGFLLAELKWQEFARQLGEARKDFFFFLLSLPHIRFLLCCGTSVLSPRRRQLMKITQQVPTVMGLVTDQRKLETNLTKNK